MGIGRRALIACAFALMRKRAWGTPAEQKKMYGLISSIAAIAGRRGSLIEILNRAVSDMPGCLSYVIAQDSRDENVIWITEVWDSKESHDASLSLPAVQKAISDARPLISAFISQVVTSPVGGHGLSTAGTR